MYSTQDELMDQLDELLSENDVSEFATDAIKLKFINKAGQMICDWYGWKCLELALKKTTSSQREYYDYPEGANEFKHNSIYQITIEDEEYGSDVAGRTRQEWDEYQIAKQNDSEEKIFSNHNGYYFLNPIPEDGKEMVLYGIKKWRTLVNTTDEAILPDEFDESIVRVAYSMVCKKALQYDIAKAELDYVFNENTGILTRLRNQEQEGGPKGYVGQAISSRS